MNSTDMPSSVCRSLIRPRIWAWIVTSSAVVGSSAISSAGLQDSAIAIMTRWRMPPDNWCGYSRMRRRGSGMPRRISVSTASSKAWRPERPWCSVIASMIWLPTVNTGLSEVIGSWKIIAMSLPRMARISASDSRARSRIVPSLVRRSCCR